MCENVLSSLNVGWLDVSVAAERKYIHEENCRPDSGLVSSPDQTLIYYLTSCWQLLISLFRSLVHLAQTYRWVRSRSDHVPTTTEAPEGLCGDVSTNEYNSCAWVCPNKLSQEGK